MLVKTTRRFVVASLVAVLAACGSAPVGPGFYRVERGDTLSKIARANRQPISNLVRWNSITNPDAIEVGQVLRVAPPGGAPIRSAGAGSSSAGSSAPPPSSGGGRVAPRPKASISLI
ncbi:LysM peptidoglycan-binding domain-containing protein, partial [Burkholderia gladioli]|uniref:LysM peptidoglycan-binding domain-containing protein n=1 Tax=Burkholderia gladioli TaxID=28095 RepID=UPI0034DB4865